MAYFNRMISAWAGDSIAARQRLKCKDCPPKSGIQPVE